MGAKETELESPKTIPPEILSEILFGVDNLTKETAPITKQTINIAKTIFFMNLQKNNLI